MRRSSLHCSKSNELWVGHEDSTVLAQIKQRVQRCFAIPGIVELNLRNQVLVYAWYDVVVLAEFMVGSPLVIGKTSVPSTCMRRFISPAPHRQASITAFEPSSSLLDSCKLQATAFQFFGSTLKPRFCTLAPNAKQLAGAVIEATWPIFARIWRLW